MEDYQNTTYQIAARYFFRPLATALAYIISCSKRLTKWVEQRDFFGKNSILIRLKMPDNKLAQVDGINFDFDFSNPLQRLVYFKYYEREDLLQLVDCAEAGFCCIDIGANFGAYALYLGQKVGPKGKVYAFEPHPDVFLNLKRNIALNPDINVEAFPFALSSTTKKGTIHLHPKNTDIGSIEETSSNAYTKGIDLIRLDDFVLQENIKKVDLIKMDVEGHELKVLEGGRNTLSNGAVKYIQVEFASLYWKSKGIDIDFFVASFESLGYELIPTDSYRKLCANKFYLAEKTANLLFTTVNK